MTALVICSDCFQNHGLRLDAEQLGYVDAHTCMQCGSLNGKKLDKTMVFELAHRFFVWGTLRRSDFGAAPTMQFNSSHPDEIENIPWLNEDMRLIQDITGIGFFYYGPRLWMLGDVEPLKALQNATTRQSIIEQILSKYPAINLHKGEVFYRVRKEPERPESYDEYDSPPSRFLGTGRLGSAEFPVLYGSQDLQVCIHECRVTSEDELYVASLSPTRDLKLLDLTAILREGVTEFESLDMAVHMLFLAGSYSYEISRELAYAAHTQNFDGVVYPSHFSLMRTGGMPFETVHGLSTRLLKVLDEYEKAKTIGNLGLFGRPISEGKVSVISLNRLILTQVEYHFLFGPIGY